MPKNNPSQVTRKIRVLQVLDKIFRHPEYVELAKLVFPQLSTTQAPLEQTGREPISPPNPTLGLRANVIKAIPSGREEFTYHEIESTMLQNGYPFKNADRRNAISGILRELVGELLVEVRKGSAGKPTIYRRAVS